MRGKLSRLIVREIAFHPPEQLFPIWADDPQLAWLDSSAPGPQGRFSYICPRPYRTIRAFGGKLVVDSAPASGAVLPLLQAELARCRVPNPTSLPFIGGAIGYFGYEFGETRQTVPTRHTPLGLPDCHVAMHDTILGFDLDARRCWIVAIERDDAAMAAGVRVARLLAEIAAGAPPLPPTPRLTWVPAMDAATYQEKVRAVLALIAAGDIYQANLSLRCLAARPVGLAPAAFYAHARRHCPAPFAAYLGCGLDLALASFSPERFLRLAPDGGIETRPIKGTRPRGTTPDEDDLLHAELARSVKDRAENLMITDLLRNDLSRVAEIGSVRVPVLHQVESFSAVHHLVSVVTAQLRAGLDATALLQATLPGGSITGAPKLRAMQIIDALEMARRGPYCGSIAWLGFDGAMDSNIVIRTVVLTAEQLIAQAGAGIVAQSVPEDEYAEVMTKIAPLLRAGDTS